MPLAVGWIRALAGGQMITGPGIGNTALSSSAVWSRAWTGWSDAGFGSPGIDGAFAGLMAPLAALPGGLRVWLGVLLIAAPLLAALGAWRAAGHATRGAWMRGSAALVYALWPPFLAAIFDGRVGPVIAHVALFSPPMRSRERRVGGAAKWCVRARSSSLLPPLPLRGSRRRSRSRSRRSPNPSC